MIPWHANSIKTIAFFVLGLADLAFAVLFFMPIVLPVSSLYYPHV